jgi:hypothetical protein
VGGYGKLCRSLNNLLVTGVGLRVKEKMKLVTKLLDDFCM